MKNKKMLALMAVIVLLLFGLAFAKTKGPQPVDWKPTFINTKTAPYGTYITYQLLEDVFEKKNVRITRTPIYNNLKGKVDLYFPYKIYGDYSNNYEEEYEYPVQIESEDEYYEDEDDSFAGTEGNITVNEVLNNEKDPTSRFFYMDNIKDTTSYIFVNIQFSLDKLDLEYLLDFVGLGNNVFISAEEFDKKLLDTLRIKTDIQHFRSDTIYNLIDQPENKYRFGSIRGQVRLNTDSCQLPITPLACNNKNDTVFIDVKYGKGHIYLHTIPSVFANVNMLQTQKYDFGFKCLSYLPESSKIIWDEYQTQGALGEGSSFKVMLNNPPLRIALYIILGGLLLFMIFRAKRTQRVIPVIKPPVNSSLEFLGTLSNLYYRKDDFKTITEKRQTYFLDFIRKHYYMSTENVSNDFVSTLSAKSGMDKNRLNELFILYKDISTMAYISNDIFLKYNSLLEEFYKSAKNK